MNESLDLCHSRKKIDSNFNLKNIVVVAVVFTTTGRDKFALPMLSARALQMSTMAKLSAGNNLRVLNLPGRTSYLIP